MNESGYLPAILARAFASYNQHFDLAAQAEL